MSFFIDIVALWAKSWRFFSIDIIAVGANNFLPLRAMALFVLFVRFPLGKQYQ
jgi:hypothetical protein